MACGAAITIELLHINKGARRTVACPRDDIAALAANAGNLGLEVIARFYACGFQLHGIAQDQAVGIKALHKNTLVERGARISGLPSDHKGAAVIHSADLRV